MLLQRFVLLPAPGHPVTLLPELVLRGEGGLWVIMEER